MEIENIKKKQPERKNRLTEMKNTLQVVNSGVDETTDQIRDLKDIETE